MTAQDALRSAEYNLGRAKSNWAWARKLRDEYHESHPGLHSSYYDEKVQGWAQVAHSLQTVIDLFDK